MERSIIFRIMCGNRLTLVANAAVSGRGKSIGDRQKGLNLSNRVTNAIGTRFRGFYTSAQP